MILTVAAHEHGVIHVFAVNRPAAQMRSALQLAGKDALAAELLGIPLVAGEVELFAVADLAGVGLRGYLADGYAVPTAQLDAARSKLDRLDGYVLLVFSAAFGGQDVTVPTVADATLIGSFGEQQPDNIPRPLEAQAAAPYSGHATKPDKQSAKRSAAGSLVVAVLVAVAVIILGLAMF